MPDDKVRVGAMTAEEKEAIMVLSAEERKAVLVQAGIAKARRIAGRDKPMKRDFFWTYADLAADLPSIPEDSEIWQLDSGAYVIGSADEVAEAHGDAATFVGTGAVLQAERKARAATQE